MLFAENTFDTLKAVLVMVAAVFGMLVVIFVWPIGSAPFTFLTFIAGFCGGMIAAVQRRRLMPTLVAAAIAAAGGAALLLLQPMSPLPANPLITWRIYMYTLVLFGGGAAIGHVGGKVVKMRRRSTRNDGRVSLE